MSGAPSEPGAGVPAQRPPERWPRNPWPRNPWPRSPRVPPRPQVEPHVGPEPEALGVCAGHRRARRRPGLRPDGADPQHRGDEDQVVTREDDLVRILDDLNSQEEQLRQQIAERRQSLEDLGSGQLQSGQALTEAQERADAIAVLNGSAPASGPGLRVTIQDPDGAVSAGSSSMRSRSCAGPAPRRSRSTTCGSWCRATSAGIRRTGRRRAPHHRPVRHPGNRSLGRSQRGAQRLRRRDRRRGPVRRRDAGGAVRRRGRGRDQQGDRLGPVPAPVATGRAGSADHCDHEPGHSAASMPGGGQGGDLVRGRDAGAAVDADRHTRADAERGEPAGQVRGRPERAVGREVVRRRRADRAGDVPGPRVDGLDLPADRSPARASSRTPEDGQAAASSIDRTGMPSPASATFPASGTTSPTPAHRRRVARRPVRRRAAGRRAGRPTAAATTRGPRPCHRSRRRPPPGRRPGFPIGARLIAAAVPTEADAARTRVSAGSASSVSRSTKTAPGR